MPSVSASAREHHASSFRRKAPSHRLLACNNAAPEAKEEEMTRLLTIVVGATLLCTSARAVRWPTYGFDLSRTRFNPRERRIGPNTAAGLAVRWFFPTGAAVS